MNQKHEDELKELSEFFQTAKFPKVPFHLNKYIIIVGDPQVMIEMDMGKIRRFQGSDNVRDSLLRHLGVESDVSADRLAIDSRSSTPTSNWTI
jgi:hypothetical protein